MRLDKVLSNLGYGSRKDVKAFIKKGLVAVNGEIVYEPELHIDPNKDQCTINGEVIDYREFIYLLMNKPAGYLSATEDNHQPTVLDLIEPKFRAFEPYPVGRLDKDTTGLLLITNDGELTHQLLSPKYHVEKVYRAILQNPISAEDILRFETGIDLKEGTTLPAKLKAINNDHPVEAEIEIVEGKFHQIKRMFHAIGNEVVQLQRIQMGNLYLNTDIPQGSYRELTEDELSALRTLVKEKGNQKRGSERS
jgi:16S rRNA pseudouridine516 synthase